ncbi:hypothetical protein Acsp02_63470 [Actinoplanes sp. NBRC 103695]|nr:hypothetical protein Acsp02_63470 [Actinoplanes sp. NBRC 103695]
MRYPQGSRATRAVIGSLISVLIAADSTGSAAMIPMVTSDQGSLSSDVLTDSQPGGGPATSGFPVRRAGFELGHKSDIHFGRF